MTHTQTVLLYDNTLTEFNETCRSSVFGILADFAADTVTAYRSDLYHDASVTTCRAHLARAVTDLLGSAIRYGNVLPTVNSI